MVIHILLLILKILGIVLLCIIGLFIFLLLVALLVPVRYHIIGLSDDSMELNIRISFLLKFFKGDICFSKDVNDTVFKIFWGLIKVKPKKKKKDYTKDFIEADDNNNEEKDEAEDFEDYDEEFTETAEDFDDDFSSYNEKTDSSKTLKKSSKKNVKSNAFSKIGRIKEAYLTETNKKAVLYLIKQIVYILKKYLPRKAAGNLFFGMTDPALTGEILGVLSVIPLMYQRGLNIYPDFDTEEIYVHGKLDISGFIQLGVLLIVVFRLIINKDSRSLIKLILKK